MERIILDEKHMPSISGMVLAALPDHAKCQQFGIYNEKNQVLAKSARPAETVCMHKLFEIKAVILCE